MRIEREGRENLSIEIMKELLNVDCGISGQEAQKDYQHSSNPADVLHGNTIILEKTQLHFRLQPQQLALTHQTH